MNPLPNDKSNELRAILLELSDTCPYHETNPSDCPLCALRKLKPKQRRLWINALSERDLMYLAAYHQICYGIKAAQLQKRD